MLGKIEGRRRRGQQKIRWLDGITDSMAMGWSKLRELVMPFNRLIFCCPLLLLPSIFPSIRVFSNESVLHIKRPKYWSFSFNISSSLKIKQQCVYHFYKSKDCSIISELHNNDSITDEKANMPESSIK